ncbi:Nitrate/nitrite response regulator protein narL [Providencia rettgeri]|uniref:Nitrate/nitrite response regulator protein narL n=1 Tax=Providencia rettgeri TaxID=587 RepID=A0A379FWS8_PRORE|nr:Nitrate/nitrite response regulator protein narL [Providencia rettgeri]
MKNENKLTGQSTILLIDDHPMLRNGVKQLISLEPTLKVIGEADDGITGIKIAEEQDPRFNPIRSQYAGYEWL